MHSTRSFGQTITVGVNEKLKPVGYFQLGIYRREVVMHRAIADEESLGNLLVLQSFAYLLDDFPLTIRQSCYLVFFRVDLLFAGRELG